MLGNQGLTSTSANYLANKAKEYVENIKESLNNISFINSEIALIGSSYTPTNKGVTNLSFVDDYLEQITKAYSLIAWLREAIKEKNKRQEVVSQTSLEYWAGDRYPKRPVEEDPLSEEEIVSGWSVKDRNNYFTLSTKVSVYGKYIHPTGAFSEARKELQKIAVKPVTYKEMGKDTIILRSAPSISPQEVENEFMKLQSEWRKAQAELNSYKHKIQQEIDKDTNDKNTAYELAYKEYNNKVSELAAEFKNRKAIMLQEIADLRIIIPNDLRDIYETILAL